MPKLNVINPNPVKPYAPRRENDLYPTPRGLVRALIPLLVWNTPNPSVLDPGAGGGVWGQEVARYHQYARVTGVELDEKFARPTGYHQWVTGDYLAWDSGERFNIILGNPPYSLAKEFVDHSHQLLAPGGRIAFLLRLEFLGAQKRREWWEDGHLSRLIILSRRPSFSGDGNTDGSEYGIYVWDDSPQPAKFVRPTLSWLDWDYIEGDMYAKTQK